MLFIFSWFNNIMQTLHQKLPDFRLSKINDFYWRRRVEIQNSTIVFLLQVLTNLRLIVSIRKSFILVRDHRLLLINIFYWFHRWKIVWHWIALLFILLFRNLISRSCKLFACLKFWNSQADLLNLFHSFIFILFLDFFGALFAFNDVSAVVFLVYLNFVWLHIGFICKLNLRRADFYRLAGMYFTAENACILRIGTWLRFQKLAAGIRWLFTGVIDRAVWILMCCLLQPVVQNSWSISVIDL